MVLWSKWHRPGGHRVYEVVIALCAVGSYAMCEFGISGSYFLFYIDLQIVKPLKKVSKGTKNRNRYNQVHLFLSETTRPRSLIFGM